MRMLLSVAALAAAIPAVCSGQWVSDPAVNTVIADRTGDQNESKIKATADGGCYISWFDNSVAGYDVYLQRLNAAGVEQWAHNGVLVRDRALSSNQNYDLEVDADGNAFIVFNDDLNANAPITAQLVSPAGVLLWGATGVQVSGSQAGFKSGPQAAILSDGLYAVAWSNGSPLAVNVQKLDVNGTLVWPSPVTLSSTLPFNLSDIQRAEAGGLIVLWVRCSGSNCVLSNKHLYAQKLDAAGAPQWDGVPATPMVIDPKIIFDGTSSIQTGYFPTFLPDGAGGAVFAWYETGGNRDAFVQRVDSAGVEQFAHNGVSVSTQANRYQLEAGLSYDASTGDIYVGWVESNTGQSQWGLYAQKVTSAGVRAWGNNGVELSALSASQGSFTTTLARAGGGVEVYGFKATGAVTGIVQGFALDDTGAAAWASQPVAVCSATSSKARLVAARAQDGAAILAWGDGRTDTNNVYAQRVNAGGTLGGPATCAADFDGNGTREVPDIFAFLSAWFGMLASADVDGVPGLGVPDIFAFLSLWFAGCP